MRAPATTVGKARRLRRGLSAPEARLWKHLRARDPALPVFRRQHPIGPYILDFYCAAARLAVEIEGIAHDLGDRPARDERRESWLRERGVTVLRIPAADLTRCFDEYVDAIVRTALNLTRGSPHHHASHGPPPARRGGG